MAAPGSDLIIKDLTVEFTKGDYTVRPLDNFGCTVPAGSLALLLGPSGCGKTTLLSCLGGILKPTSGTISFGDTEVTMLTGKALSHYRQRNVGVVFQAFNLVPSLTAVENVSVPMSSAGVGRRAARQKAIALLESVGLGDRLTHRPNRLSGGQQQRAAIVRALAVRPKLLLLDEITAALDPELVGEVLNVVRDVKEDGMTMVLATHEMGFAREVADQVCFLDGGVILERGTAEQVFGDPQQERTRRFLKRIVEAGRL